MMQKQIGNLTILVMLFIGIIKHFSNSILNEDETTFCFTQIGFRRNYINPFRNKITFGPYNDEKNGTSCSPKRCHSSSKQSNCIIDDSNILSCASCINNFNSCSVSIGHSDSCSNSCSRACCGSCFISSPDSHCFCPNLSPAKCCLTKLRRLHKSSSSNICKCCTNCESSDNPDQFKNETEVFRKFNESSEISSESEISEVDHDLEIKTNKTSSSNEVKFSYDVSINLFIVIYLIIALDLFKNYG